MVRERKRGDTILETSEVTRLFSVEVVEVKKLSVSGARATVAAPGCQTPNVTTQDMMAASRL